MSDLQILLQNLIGPPPADQAVDQQRPLRALAWARVSTGKQQERGLSIPEQFREIHRFAEKEGIEVLEEYSETVSAFQRQERRREFHRMVTRARTNPEVSMILVHDLSRFCRDSHTAKQLIHDFRREGIRLVSLNDPELDPETVAGVYMEAIILAKNEAYSREVAFHTRKCCRANVQTRDLETGWCYKNGGQPIFGYRAERLTRGEIKRGRPQVKIIWVPDETEVAGRPIHEWARYCLVELAGKGFSLAELRDFCNKTGIPARRKKYWGLTTWHALLQPSVLLQYCGHAVWNVRNKQGRERPSSEWVIVENAHQALITPDEARNIAAVRRAQSREKRFDSGRGRSRISPYLLSGGLFHCDRCGSNMIGFRTDSGYYYVCGSQPYRRRMGCGPGVYVPKNLVESEVLAGLRDMLSICSDAKGFTRRVNEELRKIFEARTNYDSHAAESLRVVDAKIANIRRAIEDGLADANWANVRLRELFAERSTLATSTGVRREPHRSTLLWPSNIASRPRSCSSEAN